MSGATLNLADLLEIASDTVGDEREAIVCGERRYSYRQYDERATRLANHLLSQGVVPGQHIGIYLYNRPEYMEATLACLKVRAVPININYRYVGEELLYVCQNADLVGLIHGREFSPLIGQLLPQAPKLRLFVSVEDGSGAATDAIDYEAALAGASPERDFAPRSEEDLFILYTGGTTGMPKGVMWQHKDLLYGSLGGFGHYHPDGPIKSAGELPSRVRDGMYLRGLPLAPLMHGACWWYSCIVLGCGQTLVLNPDRSLDSARVWGIAEREKVNTVTIVGDAMGVPLLDALRAEPGRWKLDNLFHIGSGGAVFSKSVQAGFKEFFPNLVISNAFGSSETGMQGLDDGTGGSGLGRIERGEQADVITEDHRFVVPGSGEQGYLARSGHVPVGYYNDAERTARSVLDIDGKRWMLTGDLATVDADGGIVIFGRGGNCINSGGEKIFPEEVEQSLKHHPEVFDALVIGTADARFTERVCAVVCAREGARPSLASLQEESRRHIAGYKVPRELHLVAEVPRTPSGKPDYPAVRALVATGNHLHEEQAVPTPAAATDSG